MKKRKILRLLAGVLLAALLLPMTAHADGRMVVTLGNDLTQEERDAVLKYFGVYGQNIQTIYITNQDERAHLGSYIPLEQIGSYTYSCALVKPTTSGGIQVKTANLTYVTSNMIASTLSTSGVVNCEVLAASPIPVSGTGALTGVIMAYESASGQSLNAEKKEIATQELVTTQNIASSVGQNQATEIVNEIKIQVIQNEIVEHTEVVNIVNQVVEENTANSPVEVTLSEEDRAALEDLAWQISQQQYDYEEMKETLERVEENVSEINDTVSEINDTVSGIQTENQNTPSQSGSDTTSSDNAGTEIITTDKAPDISAVQSSSNTQQAPAQTEALPEDSILLNTDDTALGENVVIDATAPEAVEEVPETQPAQTENTGFEIVTSDNYQENTGEPLNQGTETEPIIVQTEAPIPETEPVVVETEAPTPETEPVVVETEAPTPETEPVVVETEAPTPETEPIVVETEAPVPETEPVVETEAPTPEPETEPAPEVPAEPVAVSCQFNPDGWSAPADVYGQNTVSLYLDHADLSPVSGTFEISSGDMVLLQLDLVSSPQVVIYPMTDEELMEKGWSEGTQIMVVVGSALNQPGSYTLSMNGEFNDALQGSLQPYTASASTDIDSSSAQIGLALNATDASSYTVGNTITATVLANPETAAYANVSAYDQDKLSLSTEEIYLDSGESTFTMTLTGAGNASISVDVYDYEGNLIDTVSRSIPVR